MAAIIWVGVEVDDIFSSGTAAAMRDSGRPVPTTMRSTVSGSIGGYDEASSMAVVRSEDEVYKSVMRLRHSAEVKRATILVFKEWATFYTSLFSRI